MVSLTCLLFPLPSSLCPSLLFLNFPGLVLPQGFCTASSLHPDGSFPRNQPSSLVHLLQAFAQSHLLNDSLTPLFKTATPPFYSPHTSEIYSYLFAPFQLSPSILLIVHLSSLLDCKLLYSRFFGLFFFSLSRPSPSKYLAQCRCLISEWLSD